MAFIKNILAIIIIFSSNFAIAAFNGFYMGGELGSNLTAMNFDTSTGFDARSVSGKNFSVDSFFNEAKSGGDQVNAFLAQGNIGYGHNLGAFPLYLGVEIFGSWRSDHSISNNLTHTFNPSQIFQDFFLYTATKGVATTVSLHSFEYGVDIKPGIILSNVAMLYSRIGIAFNEYKLNLNSYALASNLGITKNFGIPSLNSFLNAESQHINGLRLGAGMEAFLNMHVALKGDYIYTNYGHASTSVNSGATGFSFDTNAPFILQNAFSGTSKADISSHTVLLGLDYYFTPNCDMNDLSSLAKNRPYSPNMNGFYMGGRVGAMQSWAEINNEVNVVGFVFENTPLNLTNINLIDGNSIIHNAITGSIFTGYGHFLSQSPFYLAAEAFITAMSQHRFSSEAVINDATKSPNDFIDLNNTLTSDVVLDYRSIEFGGDLKPGILLTPRTLFYGRVGFAIDKLEAESNVQATTSLSFHTVNRTFLTAMTGTDVTYNKNLVGLRLGLGFEQYLSCHWAANMDYVFTDYGNQEMKIVGDAPAAIDTNVTSINPNGLVGETKIRLKNQAITIGLSYHF